MKLLETVNFDITEYCGNLIVTYLSDDKPQVSEILRELDAKGYEYYLNEVGVHTVLKNSYVDDIQDKLSSCGCYLLFLSKNFDDKKNRALRNNIMFQVGVLESRRPGIVVPVVKGGTKTSLAGTPMQSLNIIDVGAIGALLTDKSRPQIARNEYYGDDAKPEELSKNLNFYTKDRIEYRKLELSLDIAETDFEAALKLVRKKRSNCTGEEFFDILRDEMTCGARLVSFGSKGRLTTNLVPYENEIKVAESKDYPESFTCRKVFVEDRKRTDGRLGEYKLEIILPIHKLLGVNFKCFVKGGPNVSSEVLKQLFASNFEEKNDVAEKQNSKAVYFCIPLYEEEDFPVPDEYKNDIGSICDYLYPQ